MKRLLSTSTAIALALAPVHPLPLLAQTQAADGSVIAEDGTVLCTPTPEVPCDLKAIRKEANKAAKKADRQADKAAEAEAEAAAQAAADAEAAAAAEAQAAEEAAARAAAEKEAKAQARAAKQAAAEAAAAEEAAAKAASEAEAKAAAEAAERAAAEAEAAEQAARDAAAQAEADAAAQAEAEARAAAATAEAEAEAQAAAEAQAEADAAAAAAETEATVTATDPASETAATGKGRKKKKASAEAVENLDELLAQTPSGDGTLAGEAVAAAAALAGSEVADGAETDGTVEVTETVLTAEDTRSSDEDFDTTASGQKKAEKDKDKDKKKKDDDGLSDFEKAGLVALGALAVGAILSNRDKVVANTGDRVVVERNDGSLAVYKDDDTLLRQPGSTVRTETFNDGSTRTTVTRTDGSKVVTIRDVTGRVLRRAAFDPQGREVVLIDDLAPEDRVVVSQLPKPPAATISATSNEDELALALAALQARDLGRSFSLRQIRDTREVRALAATIDVDNITFDSGSSAIRASEANNLATLGRFIAGMIDRNPREVFLIEGHTDAVGSAASNLALSDRRAESVALALTEYFDVPPENLVVQGYGESDLRIPTEAAERLNRRVAVRVITPLMKTAALP